MIRSLSKNTFIRGGIRDLCTSVISFSTTLCPARERAGSAHVEQRSSNYRNLLFLLLANQSFKRQPIDNPTVGKQPINNCHP